MVAMTSLADKVLLFVFIFKEKSIKNYTTLII